MMNTAKCDKTQLTFSSVKTPQSGLHTLFVVAFVNSKCCDHICLFKCLFIKFLTAMVEGQ